MLPSCRPRQLTHHAIRSFASKSRPLNPRKTSQSTPKPNPAPPLKTKPKPLLQHNDTQTLTLPSSRSLSFSIYGPSSPSTPTLLVFHGFPGSRLDASSFVSPNSTIRVIGIDRPGIGHSTFQPNRTLLDWPEDVLTLTRYLGIKEFRVIGGSAGGPYALACAKVIPGNVLKATGVVAGFAPVGSIGSQGLSQREQLLLKVPSLLKARTWWSIGRHIHSPDPVAKKQFLTRLARDMGIENADDTVLRIVAEPFRQGVDGYVEEALILQKPWGFELGEVDPKKKILLFYGEEDRNTPVEMGKYLKEGLKGVVLKTFPGEDHFSIMNNHGNRIIRQLMQTA